MRIAEPTVERLVQYGRLLESLVAKGKKVVSSKEIGDMLSFKASQVRKDLSYFGEIGKRGVGYPVEQLSRHIGQILASPRQWSIGIIGVGKLGEALLGYLSFHNEKFRIEALFDADCGKTGKEIQGIPCFHSDEMAVRIREKAIDVVILTVPAYAAQTVADSVLKVGTVKGILNFAPFALTVPEDVFLISMDISVELEKLLFFLKHKE